jgi:hypothetical protein
MARSVLPHHRMLELDQRLAHAAARPVIVPETIVCDHGKAFISQNFRSSCRTLGITFQPAHPRTPTEYPAYLVIPRIVDRCWSAWMRPPDSRDNTG